MNKEEEDEMGNELKNDKLGYWDDEQRQFYWIEWEETGNNDITHRHYICLPKPPVSLTQVQLPG